MQGLSQEAAQVSMINDGTHIWFENQGTNAVSNKLEREQLRILTIPSLCALVTDAFDRVLSKEGMPNIDQAWLDTTTEVMSSKGYKIGTTFGYQLGPDAKVSGSISGCHYSLMWYYTGEYGARKTTAELRSLDISAIPDYK